MPKTPKFKCAFAIALADLLAKTHQTQDQFAQAVGISDSMLNKLLHGGPAHKKTYTLIFNHAHALGDRAAAHLWLAYIHDLKGQFGLRYVPREDHETNDFAGEAFYGFPSTITHALAEVGRAAISSPSFFNVLMSLAQHVNAGGMDETFFAGSLKRTVRA
jgi:transcriptional regulator with XRE-family HTH domain